MPVCIHFMVRPAVSNEGVVLCLITLQATLQARSPTRSHPRRSRSTRPCRRLDYDEVATLCQKLIECKGTVLFTGVGKSAFIAKKAGWIGSSPTHSCDWLSQL